MFNNLIILKKILAVNHTVTLLNKQVDVEYAGYKYIIRIEPIIVKTFFGKKQKYIWLIYFKEYNSYTNTDKIKLMAISSKTYDYDPNKMQKDAFNCIQKLAQYVDE